MVGSQVGGDMHVQVMGYCMKYVKQWVVCVWQCSVVGESDAWILKAGWIWSSYGKFMMLNRSRNAGL